MRLLVIDQGFPSRLEQITLGITRSRTLCGIKPRILDRKKALNSLVDYQDFLKFQLLVCKNNPHFKIC